MKFGAIKRYGAQFKLSRLETLTDADALLTYSDS